MLKLIGAPAWAAQLLQGPRFEALGPSPRGDTKTEVVELEPRTAVNKTEVGCETEEAEKENCPVVWPL